MRKGVPLFIAACFLLLTRQCCYSQTPGKVKKINLLPVYLVYSGLPSDTSLDKIVREAFSRHKVKMITKSQFDQFNENEVRRVEAKFRVRNDKFKTETDARNAISSEQHFVSNLLVIGFKSDYSMDSIRVTVATWKATPYLPDINSSRSSGTIETSLSDTCSSVKDNIFAIVDKILLSKWLK